MTELVIRIDLKDMLDNLPQPAVEEKQVVPDGYRCANCWRQDGGHEADCPIRNGGGL